MIKCEHACTDFIDEMYCNLLDMGCMGSSCILLKVEQKLKLALQALKSVQQPCQDCRFYQDCDKKSCRAKTSFEVEQVLEKIKEV